MKTNIPFAVFYKVILLFIIVSFFGWNSVCHAQDAIYLESKIRHEDPYLGTLITPDGKYLIKSYCRNSLKWDTINIHIFNTSTMKLARNIAIYVMGGDQVSLSEKGDQIIVQCYFPDRIYYYYNIETGQKIKEINLTNGYGTDVTHDNIFCIRTGGYKGKLSIYDSRSKITTEIGKSNKGLFINNGSNLIFNDGEKIVLKYVNTGTILDSKLPDSSNGYWGDIHVAPDSKHFAIICHSKKWNVSKTYYGKIENGKIIHLSTFDNEIGAYGYINDVYFAPGDEFVYLINQINLLKYNAKTGKKEFSKNIARINISRMYEIDKTQKLSLVNGFGNEYLLITDKTNLSYFFSLKTNTVDAYLYNWNNRDYAFISSDGKMEGTQGAIENLQWVQDKRKTPLASTFEQMYTPNLMNQVFAKTLQENTVSLENIVKYTPEISITSPKPEFKTNSSSLSVTCDLIENGDEITQVRIYVNDKLVSDETRGFKAVGNTVMNKVTLLPGINSVKAIAITKNGYQSGAAEVQVTYSGAVAESKLFVLAIGINKYKNPAYNLNYAVADASAVVDRIKGSGSDIFKSIVIYNYQDELARRDSILAAFGRIAKQAQPQDAFVLFYAGHGVMSEGTPEIPKDFYLVLYNVTQLYGKDEILKAHGLSAVELRELSKKISAQKQVVFLDACQSGAAVETFAMRGAAEEKAILQLARSTGSYLIASTGSEQYATEFKELGHGVFTYTILEGLSCNADGSEKDKKVTIKELEAYLNDNIPALTEKYHGTVQYPKSWSKGMDFPIVICK